MDDVGRWGGSNEDKKTRGKVKQKERKIGGYDYKYCECKEE